MHAVAEVVPPKGGRKMSAITMAQVEGLCLIEALPLAQELARVLEPEVDEARLG